MLFHFSLVVKIESGQKFSFIILGQSQYIRNRYGYTDVTPGIKKYYIYFFTQKKSLSQFGGKNVMTDHVSWVQYIEEPVKRFQFSI